MAKMITPGTFVAPRRANMRMLAPVAEAMSRLKTPNISAEESMLH
jgi:hypothetical protein